MQKIFFRKIKWILPYFFIYNYNLYRNLFSECFVNRRYWSAKKLVKKNKKFLQKYYGQRCFILCTGPSINQERLELLRGENVISVSTGYLHPLYTAISPKFYCQPPLVFSSNFTVETAIKHYRLLESKIDCDAELFLSYTEKDIIEKNHLLSKHNVNYLYFIGDFNSVNKRNIIDISATVPCVHSVSIMATILAMYLGFTEIYLLGTEHDSGLIKARYDHAFDVRVLCREDNLDDNNVLQYSTSHILESRLGLFREYEILKGIADENSINIYNATQGGMLDVFKRRSYKCLF